MIAMRSELSQKAARTLSVAMETNNRGYHGFVVELPGAFVRGPTEQGTLAKTKSEAGSYLTWLGQKPALLPEPRIVQTHMCSLMVEDADCEILLSADRRPMSEKEIEQLLELSRLSGLTFARLYDSVELQDWVDQARVRATFYGQNNKTIREIFDHVRNTQYYYLSRIGISLPSNESESFTQTRDSCLDSLDRSFRECGNSKAFTVDKEEWTLKKVLRRFIWHDRIHAKAITRMLEKQQQLGLIDSYNNPFRFNISHSDPTAPQRSMTP